MDALIKYRNERKKEGATQAELMGLDGRINVCFSNIDQTGSARTGELDLELLVYRRAVAEGDNFENKSELLKRIDRHVYHVLGSSPARIGDVKVCHVGTERREINVSVDFNNMTVEDLARKAAKMFGFHHRLVRIVYGGRHLEPIRQLSDYHINSESTVFACERQGCDGNCVTAGYNMLSDAFLRDSEYIFKELGPDKIHELFVVMSTTRTLDKLNVPLVRPVFKSRFATLPCETAPTQTGGGESLGGMPLVNAELCKSAVATENLATCADCKSLSDEGSYKNFGDVLSFSYRKWEQTYSNLPTNAICESVVASEVNNKIATNTSQSCLVSIVTTPNNPKSVKPTSSDDESFYG